MRWRFAGDAAGGFCYLQAMRRPLFRAWKILPLSGLFLALLAFALPIESRAQSAPREQLTIGITQFPSTFNPMIDAMVAKSYILGMARRPMMAFDKDWKLVCMMCTEIPTFENGRAKQEDLPGGKKGVALRVTLLPDARWGDGKPVTTDDVIFTWEVGKHPMSGISSAEGFRRILKIDKLDDKNFVLHMDRVTFDYNQLTGYDILPAHLERAAFADPAQYKNKTLYDTDTTNPGLYAGPFRITEVVRGSHVVLEQNPYWWGQKPGFKRIVVRVIENTAALETNILSGGIDYIAGELGLALDQALAFEKRQGKRFNIVYKPGLIYEHIDLNLDNPTLADKRVRQALLYALDRQAIDKKLFDGKQKVADSFVNPLDWMYDKDGKSYPYDPARAAALLDEAGWKKGAGGMRGKDGKPLQLEINSTAGNRSRELIEQVLQSQWRAAGVDVKIKNEQARVFFGDSLRLRRFPALALYAWVSSPENVPRAALRSDEIPTAANNYAGQNYTGFKNGETDALIDAIELELDKEKRRTLWYKLQAVYAEELPVLPLFVRSDAFIMPPWLKGVEPTGHQYPSTLWVENWRAVN